MNNSIEVICADDGMWVAESIAAKAKRLSLAVENKLKRDKSRAKAKAAREAKKLFADKKSKPTKNGAN